MATVATPNLLKKQWQSIFWWNMQRKLVNKNRARWRWSMTANVMRDMAPGWRWHFTTKTARKWPLNQINITGFTILRNNSVYTPYFLCTTVAKTLTNYTTSSHDLTRTHLQAVKGDLDTSPGVIYRRFSGIWLAINFYFKVLTHVEIFS